MILECQNQTKIMTKFAYGPVITPAAGRVGDISLSLKTQFLFSVGHSRPRAFQDYHEHFLQRSTWCYCCV